MPHLTLTRDILSKGLLEDHYSESDSSCFKDLGISRKEFEHPTLSRGFSYLFVKTQTDLNFIEFKVKKKMKCLFPFSFETKVK